MKPLVITEMRALELLIENYSGKPVHYSVVAKDFEASQEDAFHILRGLADKCMAEQLPGGYFKAIIDEKSLPVRQAEKKVKDTMERFGVR